MNSEAYHDFTRRLVFNLEVDARVIGLALLGSTANRGRMPDMWSDHDFFVVTEPGAQEYFRQNYEWLPDHERIVLAVRETEHGLKILYDDGHLLEYAVFDRVELQLAKVNDYAVPLDRGGIETALAEIAAKSSMPLADMTQRDLGMVISLLLVGARRYARGEHLSGHMFIKSYALGHLMTLLARYLPADDRSPLDSLDSFRRFEQVFPDVGREISAALLQPPHEAALGLLATYERCLCDVAGYPVRAVPAVRDYLRQVSKPL